MYTHNMHVLLQALTAALAPKAMALRDGAIVTIDAVNLVPGDVILIRLGNIVPADVKLLGEEGGEPGEQEAPMQVCVRMCVLQVCVRICLLQVCVCCVFARLVCVCVCALVHEDLYCMFVCFA
jgi:hypothetical protein